MAELRGIGIEGSGVVRGRARTVRKIPTASVDWLWRGRLARGKLSVFDGDPGLGKSTMLLDVAARLSAGRPLPEEAARAPCSVLVMSAEDGEEDTIRPRLEHAGADLDRVFLFDLIDDLGLSALPSITDHLAFIEQAIESTGAALVIVDPLFAFLGVEVNANRDQDVRRALSPVKALAERTGAAFAFLRHLNKAGGMPGLYRGGGSIGIIGAARFGLLIGKDEEDPDLRVLAVQKCNIGPEMPSLGYRLVGVPGTDVATVRWTGVVTHTATTLLDQGRTTEERGAREDAKHWLLDTLATNGDSVATKDLQKLARDAGVGWRTVETVKQAIGVKAEKGKDGWSWRLPLGPRLAAVKAAENESFTTQDRKEEGEISAPESEDRNTARPHETSREDDDDDPFEEDE